MSEPYSNEAGGPAPWFDDTAAGLPHNIEAEQALLGAILINNDAALTVLDFLKPEHFYENVHARIFETAAGLIQDGRHADPTTLRNAFEHDEALREIGGAEYLGRLAGGAVTIINAKDYGRLIYDLAIRRELILLNQEMASIAYDSEITETVADQIETARKRLDQLAHSDSKDEGPQPFVTALDEGLKEIDRAVAMDGTLVGVTTGLSDLDGVTGGLLHGELCIVAGRPGMGKSALALHIAIAAAQDGHAVAFFSLEMTRSETARRALSSKTGIPYNDMRRGAVDDTGMRAISEAAEQFVSVPLIIDESVRLSTAALKARVRRVRHGHGLGLVVIDYLQLIRPDDRYKGNRVNEVSEISADLKALAKEMSVPVIGLSQLNRATEQRDNKRPQLSDLRESGAIEQDADLVIFAYRDEYYLERSEPPAGTSEHTEWADKMSAARNTMELIIAKNRRGPTVTKTVYANMATSAFGDLRRGGQ
ncbi:MAG: replicative DNA helicase [Proteobacteria bacterium]|nr:replicative DNA helicase [Pseudomonadota bacterium]